MFRRVLQAIAKAKQAQRTITHTQTQHIDQAHHAIHHQHQPEAVYSQYIQGTSPYAAPSPASSSSSLPPASSLTTATTSTSSSSNIAVALAARAIKLVRLERRFAVASPETRRGTAAEILDLLNTCGYHGRAIYFYQHRLTPEEAQDPDVIAECIKAQEKLASQSHSSSSSSDASSLHSDPTEGVSWSAVAHSGDPFVNPAAPFYEIDTIHQQFFNQQPGQREPVRLLKMLNQARFYERVLAIYQYHLTPEEAADEQTMEECRIAQQHVQSSHTAGSSSSSSYAFSSSSSHPTSPPLLASFDPLASAPSGIMYVSRYGEDPSRLQEFDGSDQRWLNERQNRRSQFITLIVCGGIFYFLYWRSKPLTPDDGVDDAESRKRAQEDITKDLKAALFPDYSADNRIPVDRPKTRLSDVIGCDEAKAEVAEVVEYLKDPAKFNRLGGKMPKGVLLLGPPGTGKTLLARAIAGEADVPFFAATGADFEEKYHGVGSKRVRELFAAARKQAPSIVFIDEIDTVGGKRQPLGDIDGGQASLIQLLTELDGFKESTGVIVVGATNFAEKLDPALLRPGRFDRHVTVSPPDIKGRKALLDYYGAKVQLGEEIDFSPLARSTAGLTGADLSHLVNTAALHAATEDRPYVTANDLDWAKDRIMLGSARVSAVNSEDIRRHISVYESGKSLVALSTPHAQPLAKVTILQRGNKLGRTQQTQSNDEDRTSETYLELLAALDCKMAGRAAEELIYGTTGVSNNARADLLSANRIARAMVMQLGFSDDHGPVSDSDAKRYSISAAPETKSRVDQEVKKLLEESHQRAKMILTRQQTALKAISQALLQQETLEADEVKQIVQQTNQNEASGAP